MEGLCKNGILKIFEKFTGKYLCWSLFLIRKVFLLNKRPQHRCFPLNFAKIFRHNRKVRPRTLRWDPKVGP